VFAGALTHVHVQVGDQVLQAMVPNGAEAAALAEGAHVGVLIAPDAVRVLPN
jgi:hypothetical protein